jgi:hypothetical protein
MTKMTWINSQRFAGYVNAQIKVFVAISLLIKGIGMDGLMSV